MKLQGVVKQMSGEQFPGSAICEEVFYNEVLEAQACFSESLLSTEAGAGCSVLMIVGAAAVRFDQRRLFRYGLAPRRANRTPLHGERLFQPTGSQKLFVLKNFQGWSVGHDLPFVKHNRSFA